MITLVAFEAFAIATVMPKIKDDLGGIGWYGWVFSAFFLANLLGIVWAGHSSDHHGPARAFTVGLLLFALGLLLGGAAPAIGWLVAARAVQGLGAGAIPAIAYVAIGRGYPANLQPRMFAVVSTAWVVPSLIGPGISGIVADTVGWRWVLLGLLPIVLIAGAIATPALRELGPPGGDAPPDRRRDASDRDVRRRARAHRRVVAIRCARADPRGRRIHLRWTRVRADHAAGHIAALTRASRRHRAARPRDLRVLRNRRVRHAHADVVARRWSGARRAPADSRSADVDRGLLGAGTRGAACRTRARSFAPDA